MYVLYSIQAQGWFTPSSTYSSLSDKAKRFEREEALVLCRNHKSQAGYRMIPVRLEDLEAV